MPNCDTDGDPAGGLDRGTTERRRVRLAVEHQDVEQQQPDDHRERDQPRPRGDVEIDELTAARCRWLVRQTASTSFRTWSCCSIRR
jgi:hypothetical protein